MVVAVDYSLVQAKLVRFASGGRTRSRSFRVAMTEPAPGTECKERYNDHCTEKYCQS